METKLRNCSVCARLFTPGVSGAGGKCSRCYARARRGVDAAPGEVLRSPDGQRMVPVTVGLPAAIVSVLDDLAKAEDHPDLARDGQRATPRARYLRRLISAALLGKLLANKSFGAQVRAETLAMLRTEGEGKKAGRKR